MNHILFRRKLSHRTPAKVTRAMAIASFALFLLDVSAPVNAHRVLWSPETAAQKPCGRNPKHLTFKNMTMGEISDGAAADLGLRTEGQSGVRLGFTAYLASDGVRLTAMQAKFASASDAERYFDLVVGRSGKILKRGKMSKTLPSRNLSPMPPVLHIQ